MSIDIEYANKATYKPVMVCNTIPMPNTIVAVTRNITTDSGIPRVLRPCKIQPWYQLCNAAKAGVGKAHHRPILAIDARF